MRYRYAWAWFLVAALSAPLLAERVFVYDPEHAVVAGLAVSYDTSRHPFLPDGSPIPNSVVDPDVSALVGVPWQQWKWNGSAVVALTAQDLSDLAAADLAARQALAQATYGQAGCDLTSGDAYIGQCSAGDVLASPLFRDAVLDTVKRFLDVADGEYLQRNGTQIIGTTARPTGKGGDAAGPVAVNGTEAAIATVANVVLDRADSRVRIIAKAEFVKDTGTTVRIVTCRIRRGGDNTIIGQISVVRSQGVASSEFGPCVLEVRDTSVSAPGTVTYGLTATTGAGTVQAVRIALSAEEIKLP